MTNNEGISSDGQGHTKVKHTSLFWVKGAGRVIHRLEKGVHGNVVPRFYEGALDG